MDNTTQTPETTAEQTQATAPAQETANQTAPVQDDKAAKQQQMQQQAMAIANEGVEIGKQLIGSLGSLFNKAKATAEAKKEATPAQPQAPAQTASPETPAQDAPAQTETPAQ